MWARLEEELPEDSLEEGTVERHAGEGRLAGALGERAGSTGTSTCGWVGEGEHCSALAASERAPTAALAWTRKMSSGAGSPWLSRRWSEAARGLTRGLMTLVVR